MKLSQALYTSILLSKVSYACVNAWGAVVGHNALGNAYLVDNGARFCDSDKYGWYIDGDGHFSIGCVDGRVYAFTQDGTTAWYGYPGWAGSFQQDPWVVDHTTFAWNVKEWGC